MDAMAPNREIELKLEFDPADRTRLLRAPLLDAIEGEHQRLVSTYFDTPDRAVRRSGHTLRVRRHGTRHLQTVKADSGFAAGLYARSEWEHAVPGDAPVIDIESGPLLQAIGTEAADQVAPAFVSEVERVTRRILYEGADVEVAIDTGIIRAGALEEQVCEMELELRGGSVAPLFDLARQLDGWVPLRLGVRSKAERGYRLLDGASLRAAKAEPVLLDRESTAADSFGVIAHACVRHFRLNEAVLLEAYDAEALHQARVALRRLRTCLSLFEPLFAGDADAALLDAELRRFAAMLAEARNLDVLAARLARRSGPGVEAARARAHAHVRSELCSARSRLLMLDLADWLSVASWRREPANPVSSLPVGVFAAEVLDSARKRLVRSGRGLAALGERRLHKVRIRTKKARYAAQFFGSLWTTPRARRRQAVWLDHIGKLQDRLGELNDLVIGERLLEELGVAAKLPGAGDRRVAALRAGAEQALVALARRPRFWRD